MKVNAHNTSVNDAKINAHIFGNA